MNNIIKEDLNLKDLILSREEAIKANGGKRRNIIK